MARQGAEVGAASAVTTILPTGRRVPWSVALLGFVLLALLVFPFLSMVTALHNAEHGALLSRDTADALWTTLVAAGIAIALDAALGIPLSYWMATTRSRLRHVALVAALLPLAVPPVVGGLELVLWLGPYGWLGRVLDHVGLNPLDSLRGTILAQMFLAAPFVIVTARAAFASLDPAVADAARSLGAGPWRSLLRVRLPLARRAILAGLLLGWLRALGEFGTGIIVAYHPYTLSTLTYLQLSDQGLRTALPTGALLAGLGIVAAAVLLWLDADRTRNRSRVVARLEAIPAVAARLAGPVTAPAAGPASTLTVMAQGQAGDFALAVDVTVPATSIAILGASGAGKSLTLRTMAGLVRPEVGRVNLAGTELLDTATGVDVPAEQRRLGYVAQEGALFRHLDVEANIAFGLAHLQPPARGVRVEEMLETFGLRHLRHARPGTLSGGERQQVALARALAPRPVALLLDEPFSSLDAGLRRTLRDAVRVVHEQTGIPTVLVTHDRDDALDLADHVVVFDRGRVVQQGGIDDVFARPATPAVARLVGIPNVVPVTAIELDGEGIGRAVTAWGQVPVDLPASPAAAGWALAVPPDGVLLDFGGSGAEVVSSRPGTTQWRVSVRAPGGGDPLVAAVARTDRARPAVGATCGVIIEPGRCHLMSTSAPGAPEGPPSASSNGAPPAGVPDGAAEGSPTETAGSRA